MRWWLAGAWILAASGCGGGDATDPAAAPPTVTDPSGAGLERLHLADPALVARGAEAFASHELVQGVLPPEAMRHLYLAWSADLGTLATYYTDEAAYRAAFDARYGTIPSPFEGATLPAGFGLADDGQVGIDCLLCHAGRLEGRTVIGLSNNRLDLRGFVLDLQALPAAITALKAQSLPAPYDALVAAIPDVVVPEPYASLEVPTGAAGLNDGFGLGLVTAAFYREPPAGMETFMGYQDAPPWWNVGFSERLYGDGSADAEGIYTMMSTLLAFGLSYAELAAYLPTFEAIRHFMCAMDPPRWTDAGLPPPDPARVAEGEALFVAECASCHGDHRGGRLPNRIEAADAIGTDPYRAAHFGADEAAFFNGFIPEAQYEMRPTGGYLAPPLVGIWASAPYLHNGSVPTLRALLVPSERPTRWRRSSEAYDAVRLGLTYEEVDGATDRDTIEGRKVVDTTVEGLGAGGHDVGTFADTEVEALLAYLSTL